MGKPEGGRDVWGEPLIARERECARLEGLVKAARAGRSGVLVVRGEAGVGKTALLEWVAAGAAGISVLRARGVEAETELAFAGLDQLLRPVLSHVELLPERQAAALRGALALSESAHLDRFAVYVATLAVLAAAAEERPLLVLVDDAHWLDRSSAEALVFVGRRLEAEGIALVFAAREGDPAQFLAPGFEELSVMGLDREAIGQLLEARVGRAVAPSVVDRLAGGTAGNPLAVIELGELLTAGQLAGSEPLDEPLAAGEAAQRAFLRRARALSAPAQQALAVAAAAGDGEVAPVLAAVQALCVGAESLGEAEAAGLIRLADGRFAFTHPLVRSAVYTAADPAERRAAHRALAEALGPERPDRRAWHLAATAVGPDEAVAEALELAAETARRRSGYAAAARALERAAQLTPPGIRRVERLVASAETARQAGQVEQALGLLQHAATEASEPRLLADIHHKRGRLEWFRGQARQAEREHRAAARVLEPIDPSRAALLLVEASLTARYAGDPAGALATARAAAATSQGGEAVAGADLARLGIELTLAEALYWSGDVAEAHRLACHAIASLEDRHVAMLDPEAVLWTAKWGGAVGIGLDRGRALVDGILNEARANGALGLLPFTLHIVCYLGHRDGQWARAYAAAAEGARIAAEVNNTFQLQWLLSYLALLEAAQGHEPECRAHVEEAQALGAGHELARPQELDEALGLLELGAGRPQEALRHLDVATAARGDQRGRRLSRQALGDLVEAHLRVTGAVPRELMSEVARGGGADIEGSAAVIKRCLAMVASDDAFDIHFGQALELHGSAWPFARARTQLCYGERLRRVGRRVDARVHLHAALDTFQQLGARPWAQRAADELRATGHRIARRDSTAAEQLTPQELQIALTVAQGATNREAGAALFLSPKTIEAHLGRVYRKLGIRSRTELARLLHDTR